MGARKGILQLKYGAMLNVSIYGMTLIFVLFFYILNLRHPTHPDILSLSVLPPPLPSSHSHSQPWHTNGNRTMSQIGKKNLNEF